MKNKITCLILLFAGFMLAGILTGCGRDSGTESGESSFLGELSEEDAAPGKADAYAGEAVTEAAPAENGTSAEQEPDWITLEEELRPSVLRITCGGYSGSGVVWEITEEEVRVVSSGHLLKNDAVCEVECYAGIYYEAKVERVLEDCDIGFAVFPAKVLKEDEVELSEVSPCGRGGEELVPGEELAVYGSMDYAAGNFVKGYLIEAEREMQFDGYESAQGLMLCGILGVQADSREEEAADMETQKPGLVDAGMSGSGVFDRQGRLLGILAGGDGRQGFAAVPVWKFVLS